MAETGLEVIDRNIHQTNAWLNDLATALGTEDRQHAYRVLRAFFHVLRDRLTVEEAADLAAQLPHLLRGSDRAGGASGRDMLVGLRGNDRLRGGSGKDRLAGASGRDRLAAVQDGTALPAARRRDRLKSGSGRDRISARDRSRDLVDGGKGRDRARVDRRGRRRDRVRRVERLG